jgi:hypothetical protein
LSCFYERSGPIDDANIEINIGIVNYKLYRLFIAGHGCSVKDSPTSGAFCINAETPLAKELLNGFNAYGIGDKIQWSIPSRTYTIVI